MKPQFSLLQLLKFTRTCVSHVPAAIIFMMLFALSPAPFALSQVPQGFNYQAVLRDDPSNNPIVSQGVQIRFTIQTAGSVVVYQETHSTATDEFGAISLVVGGGTPVGAYVFSNIDWSIPLSLKTEFEYPVSGTPDYDKLMGTTPLKSVPYALVADGFTQPVEKLGITGTTTNDEEALFEVKNNTGQTVFAVYNEGVRIYVNDVDAKGAKGGFAIGGFGMTTKTIPHQYMFISGDSVRINIDNGDADKGPKGGFAIGGFGTVKALTQKYLMVSNDSVRIYIDNADTDKGPKGGFAIGGYGIAKGKPQNLLTVNNDSVRIYIDNAGTDKGVKGGFAIGGYGLVKGPKPKYLSVTPEKTNVQVADSLKGFSITDLQGTTKSDFMNINKINYSIGHESGLKTNPNLSIIKGKYNVFMGYRAGFSNIEGYGNIFMGHESGLKTTTGSYNVYMGFRSGQDNINGVSNVFVGYEAGLKSTQNYNLYVGQGAGKWNSIGTQNTYVGCQAGVEDGYYYDEYALVPGSGNTYVGFRAGAGNWTGNNNVYIGVRAGELNNNYRSGRVFIGYNAGQNDGYDNRLYIDNSSTTTPLIWGDFTDGSEKLIFYGNVGIGASPGFKLQVGSSGDGSVARANSWTTFSDITLKTGLVKPDNPIEMLGSLNGYYFYWKDGQDKERQFGFSAQEVVKVLPEIVAKSNDGLLSLDYGKITPLLVEAIKEQQKEIESSQAENKRLQSEIELLKEKMTLFEQRLSDFK